MQPCRCQVLNPSFNLCTSQYTTLLGKEEPATKSKKGLGTCWREKRNNSCARRVREAIAEYFGCIAQEVWGDSQPAREQLDPPHTWFCAEWERRGEENKMSRKKWGLMPSLAKKDRDRRNIRRFYVNKIVFYLNKDNFLELNVFLDTFKCTHSCLNSNIWGHYSLSRRITWAWVSRYI